MSIELNELQKQLGRWYERELKGKDETMLQTVTLQALGMTEEAGELAHAILKAQQEIRGYSDPGRVYTEVVDAVCDSMVFGMVLLWSMECSIENSLSNVIEKVLSRTWREDPENAGGNA